MRNENQSKESATGRRADLRVTAGYGEWDPRYLVDTASATDAWLIRLQKIMRRRIGIVLPSDIHKQSNCAA